MNIATIPDLCLLKIFDRVPLECVLINVPLVCHRWHQLVGPSAIARRRELVLMITDRTERPEDLPNNDLLWLITRKATPSLLKKRLDWIERSFNSVSALSIMHAMANRRLHTFDALLPTINLIVNLSSRLVQLSLTTNLPLKNTILFYYINNCMPQLRSLTLEFVETNPLPKPLSVLKQLTHFKLQDTRIDFEDLKNRVLKCAREGCDRLVSLELGGFKSIDTRDWLQVHPDAAKKITEIDGLFYTPYGMFNHLMSYRVVRQLTNLFTSLTTVRFVVNRNLSIVQVFTCLRSLSQLKTLHLGFSDYDISDDLHNLALMQLPTVEFICWDCTLDNHQQLFDSFDFAHLFPCLKVAWIYYREAEDCSICEELGNDTWECAQEMCDIFTSGNHAQLRHVKIKANDEGDDEEDEVVAEWKKV